MSEQHFTRTHPRDARDLDPELAGDLLACYADIGPDLPALERIVHGFNVDRPVLAWLDVDRAIVVFLAALATGLTDAGNVVAAQLKAAQREIAMLRAEAVAEGEEEFAVLGQACPLCGEAHELRYETAGDWRDVRCLECGHLFGSTYALDEAEEYGRLYRRGGW